MKSLVFTIIGDDRPGVVELIATTVNEYKANWLGSQMGQLSGKFAGMIEVVGDHDQLTELTRALEGLPGLNVVVEAGTESAVNVQRQVCVTILGLDRPGIVREVAGALREASLNVLELSTSVSQAAMTGGMMFHGYAVADAAVGDIQDLEQRLEATALELGVEIDVELKDEAADLR